MLEPNAVEVEWTAPALAARAGGGAALSAGGAEVLGYELEQSRTGPVHGGQEQQQQQQHGATAILALSGSACRARVAGLSEGSTYVLRVRALLAHNGSKLGFGPWSDRATLRTRLPAVASLPLVRFSERCAAPPCEPDYLANHDAADVLADAALLSHFVARQRACGADVLGLQWPHTAIVRYCVQRSAEARWGSYLPCNGNLISNYSCKCAGVYDRMLARQSVKGCVAPPAPLLAGRPFSLPSPLGLRLGVSGVRGSSSGGQSEEPSGPYAPPAAPAAPNCSHEHAHSLCPCSLEADLRRLGRMPTYLPLPMSSAGPLPPADESTLLGHWYSLPAQARCERGQLPSANGCAWQLGAEQPAVIVRGTELLAAGWREAAAPGDLPLSLVLHNAAVLEALLDARAPRCCGC